MFASEITTDHQIIRDGQTVDVLAVQRFDPPAGWVSIDTDGPFDRPLRLWATDPVDVLVRD